MGGTGTGANGTGQRYFVGVDVGGTTIKALATASGGVITVAAQDLSLGGANLVGITAGSTIGSVAAASLSCYRQRWSSRSRSAGCPVQ